MLYFLAPLAVFWVTFFLMPRRYQWALMDGSMAHARVIFSQIERMADGCIDFMLFMAVHFMDSGKVSLGFAQSALSKRLESDEQRYLNDCQKYGATLPAFSAETERNMRREGHLPEHRIEALRASCAFREAQREYFRACREAFQEDDAESQKSEQS